MQLGGGDDPDVCCDATGGGDAVEHSGRQREAARPGVTADDYATLAFGYSAFTKQMDIMQIQKKGPSIVTEQWY